MAEDHELGCGSGTSRKEVGNHRILQSNLALVLETVSVALHKVKEGHGSIWTTFKSCIKVISVGSVMCLSSSSYCFSSSHFFLPQLNFDLTQMTENGWSQ